jgi:tRNA (guanine37-N1)-methyltransferase
MNAVPAASGIVNDLPSSDLAGEADPVERVAAVERVGAVGLVGSGASMHRSSHPATRRLRESVIVSELTIRPAVPADAAALAELAAETFPLACPPGTPASAIAEYIAEHLTTARFDEYLRDESRIVLVVQETGSDARLIGYALLVAGEPSDADAAAAVTARPTIEVSKFYARAAAHGTGAATRLMAASVEAATSRGAASLWLGTNDGNVRAIRFYEKHGFSKVGHKSFRLGGRLEDDWVLERPLQ